MKKRVFTRGCRERDWTLFTLSQKGKNRQVTHRETETERAISTLNSFFELNRWWCPRTGSIKQRENPIPISSEKIFSGTHVCYQSVRGNHETFRLHFQMQWMPWASDRWKQSAIATDSLNVWHEHEISPEQNAKITSAAEQTPGHKQTQTAAASADRKADLHEKSHQSNTHHNGAAISIACFNKGKIQVLASTIHIVTNNAQFGRIAMECSKTPQQITRTKRIDVLLTAESLRQITRANSAALSARGGGGKSSHYCLVKKNRIWIRQKYGCIELIHSLWGIDQ